MSQEDLWVLVKRLSVHGIWLVQVKVTYAWVATKIESQVTIDPNVLYARDLWFED